MLTVSRDGLASLGVLNRSAATADFIIDVSGYFAEPGSGKFLAAAKTVEPAAPANWSSGTYEFDGAGNIKAIGTQRFTYDALGRLTSAQIPKAQFPGLGDIGTQNYTYDAFGNMTSMSTTPALPTDGSFGVDTATNRRAFIEGWKYDESGNVRETGGGLDLAWDAVGTLRQRKDGAARTEVYLYTASDERLATYDLGTSKSRVTLRDVGNRVVRELTGTGLPGGNQSFQWERDWIYRGNAILASEGLEGRRQYHLDHLGTPRLITDGNGVRVAFHSYYPFGGEATAPKQDMLRLKFTGHERDFAPSGSVNDLDYMHARYYLPLAGRFASIDPVVNVMESIEEPQLWNRYAYVGNRPLVFRDPDGRYRDFYTGPGAEKREVGNWSEVPAVSWAFHAEGALLSLALPGPEDLLLAKFLEKASGVLEAVNSLRAANRIVGDVGEFMARNAARIDTKLGAKLPELPFGFGRRGADAARDAVRSTLQDPNRIATKAFMTKRGKDMVIDVYSRRTGFTVRVRANGTFDTLIHGTTKKVSDVVGKIF